MPFGRGEPVVIVNTPTQGLTGLAVFRGLGVPATKSVELLSVSVQPKPARSTAVVLEGAGVGAVSEQLAVVPKPTKSCTPAPIGQAPVSAVVVFTSATLPAVALIAMLPVASGVGRFMVPPVPCASWTR